MTDIENICRPWSDQDIQYFRDQCLKIAESYENIGMPNSAVRARRDAQDFEEELKSRGTKVHD